MKTLRRDFFRDLKKHGEENNIPNISWTGVSLLRFLIATSKAKKVLEMGCANGFSSIIIADALEAHGGTLLTGDISEPSFSQAKENAKKINCSNIEFRFGDILKTVSLNDGLFDLIFIDAQKSKTHLFFDFAKTLLSNDGIIVIDDTKKFAHKMETFHKHFEKEKNDWNWFLVPEKDDAILVMTKK